MSTALWALLAVLWVPSGLLGSVWILDMWFSGSLKDYRPKGLPLRYAILGVICGPINLVVAVLFFAVGLGRD